MENRLMVYLTTVTGVFHARVVAARLGAEGILTELRGDIGGTYPLGGRVEVFVESDAAADARHILLADEMLADEMLADEMAAAEASADTSPTAAGWHPQRRHRNWMRLAWVLVAVLVALYLMAAFG
ncbi:MAG: hypothetical protein ACRDX8_01035 [Acidimicrobiales bacterium]